MSGVEQRTVERDEDELRLDRWLARHFPGLPFGRLQKLLRTGQVRVDGRRARGDFRLAVGQTVRVPPLAPEQAAGRRPTSVRPEDARWIRSLVLHEDDALIVIDKPAGLAVQGGSGTTRHLDGMLDHLAMSDVRPRLVHRLDRETSGLLVLARSRAAAATLATSFRRRLVEKLYWAVVVGRPARPVGRIRDPLTKGAVGQAERVRPVPGGREAETDYRTIQAAGRIAAWLGLRPATGRTHQLRAHCAGLGSPILGDGKYGGATSRPSGAPPGLMLHAREIRLPHPDGHVLHLQAPPSPTLRAGLAWFGFEIDPTLGGASLDGFDAP
ncbi:MAG: RluA family pseudouridine synthase [Geminicoccaceae bacterium]|nr:RluA family pseudouridine synthase [Geminicoccaceae bacterium]